jgi:hypothetical protein
MVQEDVPPYRRGNGSSIRGLIKEDKEWVICFSCPFKNRQYNVEHPLRGNNADQDYLDFKCRHPVADGHRCWRVTPASLERAAQFAQFERRILGLSVDGFLGNASVLEAFQGSATALDLTSLNSLATSATAGWCSQQFNNSSNLYLEYEGQLNLAVVNTAPAGLLAVYIYCAGSMTSTPPTNSAGNSCNSSTTTGATLTFTSIATSATGFHVVFVLTYPTQDKWATGGPFTISQAFNGFLPQFFNLPVVNDAGPTLAASGNSFNLQGMYNTIA